MDETGSALAGVLGKAANGVTHGFLIASSFSGFMHADTAIRMAHGGVAWRPVIKAAAEEGLLGAKLVGACPPPSPSPVGNACVCVVWVSAPSEGEKGGDRARL